MTKEDVEAVFLPAAMKALVVLEQIIKDDSGNIPVRTQYDAATFVINLWRELAATAE